MFRTALTRTVHVCRQRGFGARICGWTTFYVHTGMIMFLETDEASILLVTCAHRHALSMQLLCLDIARLASPSVSSL